jgi:hypothetical protein
MQQTATWNFPPAGKARLAELLESLGCADVVAPVDMVAFGKRAGDLIRQGAGGQSIPSQNGSATGLLLHLLQNAPPSDRHTMVAAVTASASLLVAAGALVLLG